MNAWKSTQKKTPGDYRCSDPVPFTSDDETRVLALPCMTNYTTVDIERIRKRSPNWKIYNTKDQGVRNKKIEQTSKLSPGGYATEQSYDTTQRNRASKQFQFLRTKKECRFDLHAKAKNYIPGPGKYEKANLNKICTFSPLTMSKRH